MDSARLRLLVVVLFAVTSPAAAEPAPSSQIEITGPIQFAQPPLVSSFADIVDVDGGLPDLVSASGVSIRFLPNLGGFAFGPQQLVPLADAGSLGNFLVVDLDGNDIPDLAGLSSAGTLAVRLGLGGGAFAPALLATMPALANGIAAADFDGDAHLDLAITHVDSGRVSVWRGRGDGTFDPPTLLSFGRPAYASGSSGYDDIVVGQFGGDAAPDIAVLDHYPRFSVSAFVNQGGGTFAPPVRTTVTSGFQNRLLTTDLDRDGLDDLVIGMEGPLVETLRNVGGASFSHLQTIPQLGFSGGIRPELGDMDGDGRLDLVVAYSLGSQVNYDRNYLAVWRGLPDGTFGEETDAQVGRGAVGAAVGDLDGDGRLDALGTSLYAQTEGTTGLTPGGAWLFHGLAGGPLDGVRSFFADQPCSPGGCYATTWTLATVRAHAPADLFVTRSGKTLMRRNRGAGWFEPGVEISTRTLTNAPDLDGDGRDELLALGADSVGIVRTIGDATWAPIDWYFGATFDGFADFDGDGRRDLALHTPDGRLQYRPGIGAGAFGAMVATDFVFPLAAQYARELGDTDGDGRAEVLISVERTDFDSLFVIALPPGGGLDTLATIPMPCVTGGAVPFCRRGQPHLARSGPGLPHLYVLMGSSGCDCRGYLLSYRRQPDGSYVEVSRIGTPRDPLGVNVADFDLDGVDDAIFSYGNNCCVGGVEVYRGALDGSLSLAAAVDPGAYTGVAFAGNLDGDDRPDLVVPMSYYGRVAFVLNRTFVDQPTPTRLSLVGASAEPGVVRLEWFGDGAGGSEALVERRGATSAWTPLGTIVADGSGRFRFEDRDVVAGARYAYRLVTGGAPEVATEAWIDVPSASLTRLDGVHPNPATREALVSFDLARAGAARLDVLDLLGRRVAGGAVTSFGAGRHVVPVPGAAALRPGVYVIRLESEGRAETRRFVVIR